VDDARAIVGEAQALFGPRLCGLFAFGSRVAGGARSDSDLDVGVWLDPPIRRQTTWVPWVARMGHFEPQVDPTFFPSTDLLAPERGAESRRSVP
jgi:hypothetical protein